MTTVGIQELEPRQDQRPKSQDHSLVDDISTADHPTPEPLTKTVDSAFSHLIGHDAD
jgi:hypothetical protein